ncbi:MAG: GGDEF domain-containing protein [Bacillota bacterium]
MDSTGWTIIGNQSQTEIINAKNNLNKAILIVGFLSILVAISLGIFLTKYKIIKPLEKLSNYDLLTETHSRHFLNNWLKNECQELKYIVMIDINDFKSINDKFGHMIGDKVLVYFSKVLKNKVNNDDLVIRFGGDEFILIFNNPNVLHINTTMKKINKEISNQNKFSFKINFSYGIQKLKEKKEFFRSIEKADKKMYKMKNTSKSC